MPAAAQAAAALAAARCSLLLAPDIGFSCRRELAPFFDRKFNLEECASYLTFRKLCCGGPGFFCGGDADDDARHPLPPLRKACADAGCAPSVPGGDAAGCRSDHGGGGRPGLDASAVPRTAAPACDLSDDPAAEPMD